MEVRKVIQGFLCYGVQKTETLFRIFKREFREFDKVKTSSHFFAGEDGAVGHGLLLAMRRCTCPIHLLIFVGT
jgi:hypothetical protein